MAQAQAQGSSQFVAAAQDVVRNLFNSQEYTNLGKTDLEFVYDLFAVYRDINPGVALANYWKTRVQHTGRANVLGIFEIYPTFESILANICLASTYDADLDGLPDYFENQIANAFTPYYHVSSGETDNFATFNDSLPQTLKETFGQTPLSHFRVKPLGFARNSVGTLFSVLRIDYLTLWDHDSGIAGNALCAWNIFGLDDLIGQLGAHNLDNERSAALVAAPVSGYSYETDPSAYHAYSYYAAGHEGTISDTSSYIILHDPMPAGSHIQLALARSKHATYFGNPNGLPLTPWWIINGVFAEIDYLYINSQISYVTYLSLLAAAYDVFYACIIERFTDIGGQLSPRRLNVGEPTNPINASGFIQSSQLSGKLTTPLWILQ